MDKRILLALALAALAAGCISQTQLACDTPYSIVEGRCCLDANGNGVCDEKEATSTTTTVALNEPGSCTIDAECGPAKQLNPPQCAGPNVVEDVMAYKCVESKCVEERERRVISSCMEGEICVNLDCVKMP